MKRRLPGLVLLFVLLALLLSATALAEDSTIIKVDQTYVDTNFKGFWELQAGNTYQLIGPVTINGSYLRVGDAATPGEFIDYGPATLDLNGYTLTIQNPPSGELYSPTYYNNGQLITETSPVGILVFSSPDMNARQYQLTLKDSSTTKTGKLDVQGADAIGIYVGRKCTLNIEGGTITNSYQRSGNEILSSIGIKTVLGTVNMTGGCIEKQYTGVELSGGTFTMDSSAEIADCGYLDNDDRAWGGGVYADKGFKERTDTTGIEGSNAHRSILTMDDGTIRNCMSAAGGGVYLDGDSTFTMSGGTITGCKAVGNVSYSGKGGGVYVGNGTFTMDGGTISNCEAANSGGGVYVHGTFTMSDGTITNCKTASSGGGVTVYKELGFDTTFTMSGGSITKCEAVGGGGGVFVWSSGFNLSGSASITDCKAAQYGDCILIDRSDAVFSVDDSDVTINGQIMQYFGNELIGGLGTAKFPYQIGTKNELVLFGKIVNGTADNYVPAQRDACAVLTADIDLENAAWTPIGPGEGSSYTGTFDGKGYTIKNLNVSGSGNIGLFGYTEGATIRNLTVAGSVTGTNESGTVGGIVGYASRGTIENCGNLCIVNGNIAGGIVGHANDTTISACYNAGEISGGSNAAGGLVGWFTGSDGVFYDCYNVGTVYSDNSSAGGIVGLAGVCSVYNCYNAGAVTSDGDGAYGIGYGAWIENSYYLKGTTADSHIGAIEKSAEEFADGTVLKALKDGKHKSEDPWADECQYVDAAGLTLPVFKNQNTHKHQDPLEHVPAKAPTTSADGNIEYWYCEACEKYFSDADAKNEITQAQTVIPKRQSSGSNHSYYTIKATAGTGGSISPSGNVSVREGRDQTFTITPDKGYAVSNVKIDGKSIGAVKSYTFENVSRTHTIEVIFMKANGNPQTGVFVDVATGSYYEDAVDWAVENGITQGTDDAHFSPDGICTRAQAVTFLWRAAGSPAPTSTAMTFTDVPAGSFYYDAVLWAIENGVTKGTSTTTFSPNDTCDRGQIVTFLYRAMKSPEANATNPFQDVAADAYYADAVLWAVEKGVTTGTSATTFSPNDDCTRAQIVTFLYRSLEK